ncbi:hypothetical protein BDW62DRAFT_218514 [Aspergillus aurantiobrunneus]
MPPRYSTVAVIGSGPAGISALKALHDERAFATIKAFERRDSPGGTWNYVRLPSVDATMPTAMCSWLDTNVPAELMVFTHTPFPDANSPISTERYGVGNATRPYHVVARYLLDLVVKFRGSILLNTTAEEYDAVIIATGQYNVSFLPKITGLDEVVKSHPEALEHVNAFRSPDDYAGKKVVVIQGSFSAGDAVGDIYTLVQGPLYVSQSSHSPYITEIWKLPNVELKPTISHIEGRDSRLKLTFSDGSELEDVDKVIFATGYRLSFPFLTAEPMLIADRPPGIYQHVFKIGDPSLAAIGLVRAPLLFRMIEYEAVAVARYYAGRGGELPSQEDQERWETEQVKVKGDGYKFHDATGEMKEHMEFMRNLAGTPTAGTDAYELPQIADEWLEKCFSVFRLKDEYWGRVRRREAEARK